jgi:hypothetical protein
VIDRIQTELALRQSDGFTTQLENRVPLFRRPQGQIEFFDLIVSFTTGVASNATDAWLRATVEEMRSKGRVEIIELGLSKNEPSAPKNEG